MKKVSSNTLMSREEKDGKNSFDSATSEKNYPEKTYQSFNSTFVNTLGDDPVAEPFGYSEGKISPVEEENMPGPKEASLITFKKLISSASWSSIATFNINLESNKILKYSSNKTSNFYKDLRFSSIEKKYDLFYFDFSNIKKEDLPYCINNALANSRPYAIGFISGVSNDNLKQILKLGFLKSNSLSSDSIFFLKKNDLGKISSVKIYNKSGLEKAGFMCDIAETLDEKIAGLQPYKDLKYGSGLIFPYEKPQDVTYHMGSVSFPIDIIFIDSKNKIKKISSNILPGTLGVFGSSDISSVLEISGGASDLLGIAVGDKAEVLRVSEDNYSSFYKIYFNHDKESSSPSSIVKMAATSTETKKGISIYNFDNFINFNQNIFEKNDLNKFASKNSSLSEFLSINSFTPFEIRRAFFEIKKDLENGKRVVIATSAKDHLNVFKNFFVKRASEEVLFDHKIHSLEFISIPSLDPKLTTSALVDRYSSPVLYKIVSLDKIAGAPIPDDVRESASKALETLLSAKKDSEQILNAFKNNSEQYLKNKDKVDLVKKSEKSYNLSCKRIAKKIVEMLLKIKESIKIMNKIKDLSAVDEKIESLSLACREFTTTAEGIFNLESKIKEDNFVDQLSTETNRIDKSTEDLENNINNFSDYISKNILNKRILSR